MKAIGILAGMGPRSTAPFLELVLDQCQEQYGATYDIDFPHIHVYSLPTPFYIDRPTDAEALKKVVLQGLKKLASFGVSLIAMPCNTVHAYFEEFAAAIDVPLLNMIHETLHPGAVGSRVTLLATEQTRSSNLYQQKLKQRGQEYVFQEAWQPKLNEVIALIKAGADPGRRNQLWNELLESIAEAGTDTAIVACTDLTVVLPHTSVHHAVTFVDSSKALAQAVVRDYLT